MKHDDELIERVARAICQASISPRMCPCKEAGEFGCKGDEWAPWRAAQAALDAAFEWRDIQSCPGGMAVLGYGKYGSQGDPYHVTVMWRAVGKRPNGTWGDLDKYTANEYIGQFYPTHWLPLPPAPEE